MRVLILVLTAAAPAMFAQARGGGRVRGGPAPRVIAPAPGGAGVIARPGFAPVYIVGGGYYPVPVYGAGYADPYAYAPAAPPPPPDPNAAPPGQANNGPPPAYYGADPSGQGYPTILVNPNYTPQTANPLMRDYSYLPPAGDASSPQNNGVQNDSASQASVVFLIAMRDHAIYPAIAYWVENDTLNYITQQGKRIQIPLGQVDRDFSVQLNKDRNIDFALPTVTTN